MVLCMGAPVAIRYKPVISAFYQSASVRLAAGKTKKVALTARMRKLLVILNGMVNSGQHWKPDIVVP